MTFKTFLTTTLLASSALLAAPAMAQQQGDTTAALGLSTFGANAELGYFIQDNLRVRGALMGGLSASGSFEDSDEFGSGTFDYDGQLGGASVMLDYYPTQTGWRLSGGAFFSNTDFSGTAVASGADSFEFDGQVFTSGDFTTTAKFKNEVSPVVTTGYDWTWDNGFSIGTEVGAVITGGIDLAATSTDGSIQSAIDGDADYQQARRDAADIKAYPYLSVVVGYKF